MPRIKVKLQDSTPARVIFIDPEATLGASLDSTLFMTDGSTVATPALVRAWLGVAAAPNPRERPPSSGVTAHRLLTGLTLGDDHPQYTQWAQEETIVESWNWTIDGVQQWIIDTTEVHQTVPLRVTNYDGILIENPDFIGAGVHITTQTGTDPLNNGIGNQIAFWEVGDDPGSPFTPYSYGFRFHHSGEINGEGNLDFYRHTNSVSGSLFMRFTRESDQVQFTDGAVTTPVITNIGDLNTGIYFRVADEMNISAGGVQVIAFIPQAVLPQLQIRNISGAAATPSYSFNSQVDTGMYYAAPSGIHTVHFASAGVLRLSVNQSNILSTVPFIGPIGSASAPTYSFTGNQNTGVFVPGTNILALSTNSTERLRITELGEWGLAGANFGTLNQVLTSNGAGGPPTWQDAGAGSVASVIGGVGIHVEPYDPENPVVELDFLELTSEATPVGSTDYVAIYSGEHLGYRKVLLDDLPGGGGGISGIGEGEGIMVEDYFDPSVPIVSVDIPGLPVDTDPDAAADYLMLYSQSSNALRKILVQDLPVSGSGAGQVVQYDVYTADDTWNKPNGFAFGMAIGIGQGGGGASGRLGVAGGGRVGGGGGGGAGRAVVNFTDADVGSTAAINVNGGGTGGAARTTTAQDGAAGVAGEATTFGSLLTAGGGGGGTGGTNSGNAAAGTGGTGNAGNGSTGGTGFATTQTNPVAIASGSSGAGGGGGGAGVTAANADGAGVAGAASNGAAGGIAPAGSPPGGNGGDGGSVGATYNTGGGGGGSGNGSDVSTTLGGDGGAGGQWGGGGGGGAGSTLLTTVGESGAGGAGGSGVLIVISWLNVGAGTGLVDSVDPGDGILVDISDPVNPLVSLDEAFAPTWTGIHEWSSAQPQLRFIETDQASGAQSWRIRMNGGVLIGEATSDDFSTTQARFLGVTRSGTTITDVAIGNATDNPTLTLLGTNQFISPVGSVGAPTLAFAGDLDTGIYWSSTGLIAIGGNGALGMRAGGAQVIIDTLFRMSGVLSPAQLTANTDNYAPTGIETATSLRLSTDASRNLTGISTAAFTGRLLFILNIGAQDLVLVNDATSTAANRFLLGANITIGANEGVTLWYDTVSSRWRCVGKHV